MSKFPKKKMTPLTEEELNAVTISSFIRKQLKSSVQEKVYSCIRYHAMLVPMDRWYHQIT